MEHVSTETPIAIQAEPIATPAVQESRIERKARELFDLRDHISLVAIVEQPNKKQMSNVTIFERGHGSRISVEVQAGDHLESGVESLALRYSNARLEILHV